MTHWTSAIARRDDGGKMRDDRKVGLVETMQMTADGLRLTACGPDEDEIRIVEDLPKAKTPHVWANG